MGNAGLGVKRPDGDLDRVRGIMIILSALAAATLVPALLMTLWYLHGQLSVVPSDNPYFWVDIGQFFSLCFMVTALHVVLLGGPAYALLKWRNLVRWWSGVLAGLLLAVMPIASPPETGPNWRAIKSGWLIQRGNTVSRNPKMKA